MPLGVPEYQGVEGGGSEMGLRGCPDGERSGGWVEI